MSFCKAFNLPCSYGEIHTILVKLPLNQDICIYHDFCIFLFNTCINKKQSTISPSFRNINPNWDIGTETLEPVQKPLNPWFIRQSKDALTRKPVFISELTICWTRWYFYLCWEVARPGAVCVVCGRVYCTHITGRGGRLTVMCFVSRGELTFVCTHSWKGAITPVISLCWCDNLCVIVFGCIINL